MSAALPPPRLIAADVSVGDRLPQLQVDVTARTVVMGASASRDWQPQHHDHAWAHAKQGTDIFLNTPNQAGWIGRYLSDWTGPHGRLGKVRFRMKDSIQPGHDLRFDGRVTRVTADDTGCTWVDVAIELTVAGTVMTQASARVAVPADPQDNPWERRGDRWTPGAPGDLD